MRARAEDAGPQALIPVTRFSATENKSVSFYQHRVADCGRVRQKRVCHEGAAPNGW